MPFDSLGEARSPWTVGRCRPARRREGPASSRGRALTPEEGHAGSRQDGAVHGLPDQSVQEYLRDSTTWDHIQVTEVLANDKEPGTSSSSEDRGPMVREHRDGVQQQPHLLHHREGRLLPALPQGGGQRRQERGRIQVQLQELQEPQVRPASRDAGRHVPSCRRGCPVRSRV